MAHALKVLFMTATETMRGLYARQFAGAGFELAFVNSFSAAHHRAAMTRPEFFVADLDDVDRETLGACRKFLEFFPDVHLLLLCPVGEADRAKKATGAATALAKPANPRQVAEAVDNALIEAIGALLKRQAAEEAVARRETDPETGLATIEHFEKALPGLFRGEGRSGPIALIAGRVDLLDGTGAVPAVDESALERRRFSAAVRRIFFGEEATVTATVAPDGAFRIVVSGIESARVLTLLHSLATAVGRPGQASPRPSLASLLRNKKPAIAPSAEAPLLTFIAVLKTAPPGVAAEELPEQTDRALKMAVDSGARDKIYWLDESPF
jgi:ActR/RegA family two-component response regulator